MKAPDLSRLVVVDASEADIPAIDKTYCRAPLMRDYLRAARQAQLRCLILCRDQEIIGFALLVFRRPEIWPGSDNPRRLPEIVGLSIKPLERCNGYGSRFMRSIEAEAVKAGHRRIYLSVVPDENPRALQLFRRLGYQPLGNRLASWRFTDSEGNLYQGEKDLLDMFKTIGEQR